MMISTQKIMQSALVATAALLPLYSVRVDMFGVSAGMLEILVIATTTLWLCSGRAQAMWGKLFQDNTTLCAGAALIAVGTLFSLLFGHTSAHGIGVFVGWVLVPIVWALLFIVETKKEPQLLQSTLIAYFLSAVAIGAIALGYLFFGVITYDGRLSAFYLSPNHLAMFLAPAVIIGACLLRARHGFFYAIATVLLIIVVYYTKSYATWMALLGGAVIAFGAAHSPRRFAAALACTAVLFGALILSQHDAPKVTEFAHTPERSSIASRITIWQVAGDIIGNNSIFGIGPDHFQEEYLARQEDYPPYLEWAVPHPHNTALTFWLSSGILGITGFLALSIWACGALWRAVRRQKNSTAIALLAILVYSLLHGLVDTLFWKNDLAFLFWLVIGGAALLKTQDDRAVHPHD